MRKQALRMVLVFGLAAFPLLAHGGGEHLKGTVSAIGPERIAVKDADGHESVAAITPQTRFLRGKAVGKRDDLHPGDRVVVHTRKSGDGLEAVEVHSGGAARKAR